jgi:hypothetical protein
MHVINKEGLEEQNNFDFKGFLIWLVILYTWYMV